ncbi:MAG: hypothetical protein ACXQTS_06770 [Candidatus Methanospirareceae archaeon]
MELKEMFFNKSTRITKLLKPPYFEEDTQEIEYREDFLTGVRCRINVRRTKRVKQSHTSEDKLEEMIMRTREKCFFCPENIERDTPLFIKDFYERGRIEEGGSYLFPNLFPFAEYHAVATITSRHYLELDEFKEEEIEDNIKVCKEFFETVYRKNSDAKYPLWVWNYMPSAAASIIHPHVQVIMERRATPYLELLLKRSQSYFLKTGTNYWEDLVREEKKIGQRYIAENDSLWVIASFAPMGNREIMVIFKDVCSFADIDTKQIRDFANCIVKILRAYKKMGVNSFNITTYSAPMDAEEEKKYYLLNAKIISRPNFKPFYTNDTGFMERFHYEWVIEVLPEDVAKEMRKSFAEVAERAKA